MNPIFLASVNAVEMAFGILGGLALFIFGMDYLSEGLKNASGERLRKMLENATSSPPKGLLVGTGVTSIIQSSSATTVILIGLISAGLITLVQAIPVILGANIGTTFTIWIVSAFAAFQHLKITHYAGLFVAIGFTLTVFFRSSRTRQIGRIFLGIGLVFIGLGIMKDSVGDLGSKEESPFRDFLLAIGDRPFLALLAGTLVTVIVQSSSASITMLVILAGHGGFGDDYGDVLRVCIPFVLGDNIGTTITAQLAALRSNRVAKRAAMAHALFNITGAGIVFTLTYVGLYPVFIEFLYLDVLKSVLPVLQHEGAVAGLVDIYPSIALAHTMFNLIAALIVLPFTRQFAGLIERILPTRSDEEEFRRVTLDEHLLETPALAISQIRKEIVDMLRTARRAVDVAARGFREGDTRQAKKVASLEDATDEYQTEITRYLVGLSQKEIPPDIAGIQPVLLHSVNDIERVADHAMNIVEITQRKTDKKYDLGPNTDEEIDRISDETMTMFGHVIEAFECMNREHAVLALESEGTINELDRRFRENHVDRLNNGESHQLSGLVYIDFLQNMEKIGDHLANVAQGLLSGSDWPQHMHEHEDAEQADATADTAE